MPDARALPGETRPYRPSNGTEGECFYEAWCARCTREQGARKCRILTATFAHDVDEPEYPKEWVQDAEFEGYDRNTRCTAFRDRRFALPPSTIRDKRQLGLPDV